MAGVEVERDQSLKLVPRWPASFRSSSRADGLRVCRMDFLATASEERFWLRALATMKDKGFGRRVT